MITAHLNLLRMLAGDPCAGAPTISSVSASTASWTCGNKKGTKLHTGTVYYTGSMTGFKVEWEVYSDGDYQWETPDGGQYTTPGSSPGTNTDDRDATGSGAYANAGTDAFLSIGTPNAKFRCRICLTDGTVCSGWTESSTSSDGSEMFECL
jgi:hypothetical protein